MVTIKMTHYQKADTIRYLESAKKQVIDLYNRRKVTKKYLEYETGIINGLIDAMNGKSVDNTINTASKSYREKNGKKRTDGDIKYWRKI